MKFNPKNPIIKTVGFNTNHERNAIGLDNAYGTPNKLFLKDNQLFIAGTSSAQDVIDDFKIPFHLTRFSQRYKDADKLLAQHPEVNEITGHSLGSAVATELQTQHPERNFKTDLYGSPFLQIGGNMSTNRFRHPLDVFSMFDQGAQTIGNTSLNLLAAHSYKGF
jgi:hypothetical protein